jgi:hypothetical protein
MAGWALAGRLRIDLRQMEERTEAGVKDERRDPVEIIAKVGGIWGQNPARVLEVWMYLAEKAGWDVVRVDDVPLETGDCGVVDVEGLRYRIRQAPRVRTTLMDDSTGHLTRRPIFATAGWVEPMLDEGTHVPRTPDTPAHAWWLA